MEIWKDIKDYEGLYQVSNYGAVKSLSKSWATGNNNAIRKKSETIMKQATDSTGYKQVWLSKNNSPKNTLVHRLVAMAFIDNINNKKCVNHINSIRNDNRVENLEWCTHSENIIHCISKNRKNTQIGINHWMTVLSENDVINIRELSKSMTHQKISEKYPVTRRTVGNIINRKIWKHI